MILKARSFRTGFVDSDSNTFDSSPLVITASLTDDENRLPILSWQTHADQMYQIQFSDDLVNWFDFDFPLGGNGSPASYENHPLVPSPDARCFRIIAFPRE